MTASATRAPLDASADTTLPYVDHWIDGAPAPGESDRSGVVYNPATGKPSARVRFASSADVDRAVASATRAFSSWSRTAFGKRASILFRFRELVVAHSDELAR